MLSLAEFTFHLILCLTNMNSKNHLITWNLPILCTIKTSLNKDSTIMMLPAQILTFEGIECFGYGSSTGKGSLQYHMLCLLMSFKNIVASFESILFKKFTSVSIRFIINLQNCKRRWSVFISCTCEYLSH